MLRKFLAVAVAAATLASVAACSSSDGKTSSQGGGKKVIDWVMIGANNPYWTAEDQGAAEPAGATDSRFTSSAATTAQPTRPI